MAAVRERFVVDDAGKRVGVILDIADYTRLLEELEELDSIRAYDRAKSACGDTIPFEQAVKEIELDRT